MVGVMATARQRIEAVFIVVLVVELVGMTALAGRAPGSPLEPRAAAGVWLALLPVFLLVITAIKSAGRAFASRAAGRLHADDPVRRAKTVTKFGDQSWQLFVHVCMTALEYYVLELEEGGTDWMRVPSSLWPCCSTAQIWTTAHRPSIHHLYLLQAVIWMVTAFSHVALEERHNDYLLMLCHHVVTLALIVLSYWYNYVRVGVVVLFLHDSSDIVVDLLKMANYLNLEGPRGLFCVELLFVANLAAWGYLRLFVLPLHVIWRGVAIAPRELYTAPGAVGMEAFTAAAGGDAHTRGHARGYAVPRDLGQPGKFDLLANIRALPTHETLPLYWSASALLAALAVMHLAWYLMFWRLLYRMTILGEVPQEAGDEVYEGDAAHRSPEKRSPDNTATRRAKAE